MASNEQLNREIAEIVAEIAEVEVERVTPTIALEELGIDSLDGLRIVAAVEQRYGIVIDEAEIARIRAMPDVLALVERHAADVD